MKKIICIGDSNTYGYDPRSYLADRYAKNVRWTGRLEEAGFEVINLGMNGICIPKDGRSMVPLLEQYEPYDLCVVMLGSNDVLEGADARECAERMRYFSGRTSKEGPAHIPGAVCTGTVDLGSCADQSVGRAWL